MKAIIAFLTADAFDLIGERYEFSDGRFWGAKVDGENYQLVVNDEQSESGINFATFNFFDGTELIGGWHLDIEDWTIFVPASTREIDAWFPGLTDERISKFLALETAIEETHFKYICNAFSSKK